MREREPDGGFVRRRTTVGVVFSFCRAPLPRPTNTRTWRPHTGYSGGQGLRRGIPDAERSAERFSAKHSEEPPSRSEEDHTPRLTGGKGRRCTHVMHSRSGMIIDRRIPTMQGGACRVFTDQADIMLRGMCQACLTTLTPELVLN